MVTLLLVSLVDDEKNTQKIHKKYTRFAGHFEDHADAPVRFGVHRPIEHNQGFTRSH